MGETKFKHKEYGFSVDMSYRVKNEFKKALKKTRKAIVDTLFESIIYSPSPKEYIRQKRQKRHGGIKKHTG